MTRQMGRSMIVIVLVVASLIASSGVGATESIDDSFRIPLDGSFLESEGDGISCTYSISPTSQSFGDIGGSGSLSVTSPGDCSWTATSNDDWITVTSGNSGSVSGIVAYSVDANPDASSRTGTITIVGETFMVTQDGISCTYSISPTSQSFGDIGGSGSLSVTSPDDCSWTATSNDDWITVTSGDSGSGLGTVGYSVDANPDSSSRTGTMTIAGETFTLTQDAIDVEASESSSGTPPSIDYQWALSVNGGSINPGDDGTNGDMKTQVMPIAGSGMDESEKYFKKYVVVSDLNGIDDIDVVYEQLRDPNGVAMGPEVLATDITADNATWTEAINQAYANNLITEVAKDDMLDRLRSVNAGLKIYIVENCLTNHDAPGDYQVYFKVFDKGGAYEENSDQASIGLLIVEYMSLKAFEIDFTTINYGPVLVNSRKVIAGDEDWNTPDRPTIKNQGNVDINLVVGASSMWGQDPDTVSKELPADYLGVEFMGEHVNSIYAVLPSLPGSGLASPVTLQGVLTPCTATQISFDMWIDPAYGVPANAYAGTIDITIA